MRKTAIGLALAGSVGCMDTLRGAEDVAPAVVPAVEQCGNGLDDDQDGRADEGCSCEPGEELACYLGPAGTRGVGACRDGTMECALDAGGEFGVPGACVGTVGPARETCNGEDDDCDGLADNGCPGVTGEACNGRDDDADGRIDEDRACGDAAEGDGDCLPGAIRICDAYCGVHQRCDAGGAWGPCLVDDTCAPAPGCSRHEDCPFGEMCDFGGCVPAGGERGGCTDDSDCFGLTCVRSQGVCVSDCFHHSDCGPGLVCDMGMCGQDHYLPGHCP